ncbi:hypothetical protein ACP70R_005487 [Stipagrostis hirtigluma subsp. patula]
MVSNLQVLGALLLCLCTTSSGSPIVHHRQDDRAHRYLRFADVRRQCQPVLSSAGEVAGAGCAECLKRELSFEKGDWRQDAGHAPLMPFDGGADVPEGAPVPPDPLPLASFMLTHVDAADRARTAVNVSGVLVLSISRERTREEFEPWMPPYLYEASPEFELLPGSTKLKILFEGVYTEGTRRDGGVEDGERVLCMVRSAVLPTRGTGGAGRSNLHPPVVADGNVVLVLRYPKELTLTTRAVHGEMRSTNAVSDAAYFDTVRMMSKAGMYNAPYHFRSDELVAAACSPWPFGDADAVASRSGELHRCVSICEVLNRFAYRSMLTIVPNPNWQCGSKDPSCRRLEVGMGADEAAEAFGFDGDAIALQDIQCRPSCEVDGSEHSAKVSAVFQVLSPREHQLTAAQRAKLDSTTLTAEGVWKASAGQACMVGCLGGDKDACHYRVCLYVPTTFSIIRRSIMVGRISGINAGEGDGTGRPLLFEQRVPPLQKWGQSDMFRMAYNYTKVERAREFHRRSASPPFSIRDIVAKSLFLSYPTKASTGDEVMSLFRLADELTLRFMAMPDLFPSGGLERPVLHLEMLAVEQAVGPFRPRSSYRHDTMASSLPRKEPAGSGRRPPLNVAAELKIIGKPFGWSTALSLEGVYSPEDGRMYLVGCRDVRLPWQNMSTSGDLGDGMDCSIEVKVEYPPTTTHWLIRSTATAHITSTRSVGDPLRFSAVKLKASPVLYQKRWRDALSGRIINGVLCAAVLSAAIAASLGQLRYLKDHADVAPYVSHAMLTVQVVGYGMPLVTGFEALLEKVYFGSTPPPPPSSSPYPYYTEAGTTHLHRAVDQTVKLLVLAALLLTLRISQKVRRSRARMLACSPLEPERVPAERKVLVCNYGVHLVLFVLALALNGRAMTAEQLVALMQDLFLLPQVVGNAVWRVNCKPLKESYYLGVTAARVLPHVYGYVRPPAVDPYADPYSDKYFFFPNPGDLVVPLVAVVLALAVCVQQRWNYVIVSWVVKAEKKKSQHVI